MSDIYVEVTDQVLTITEAPEIASGGVNEDRVIFTFDETWDGFEKVACFFKGKGNADSPYKTTIDVDTNTAVVPHEVTKERGLFYFGVVGVKGDITLTSEALSYRLRQGAYRYGETSKPPTDDIFTQMLEVARELRAETAEYTAKVEQLEDDVETIRKQQVILLNDIPVSSEVVFNDDGSITTTFATGVTEHVVFNADGSITTTRTDKDGAVLYTKTTVFNADGSITEDVVS